MQDNIVDILIVGAGPSGLILACALAKNGIKFRIIDKRHSSSDIPRAININNAALAIFEKLNIDKQFWKAGLKLDELTAYWNQKRILNLNYKYIEADYPYFYHLEQSKIEQYLIDLLQKMGITVDREVSLIGLEQYENKMIAELINAEGVISKNRFTYVVGCDGGHSSVRALLNIAYQQQTYFSHFILMDAILEESYSDKNLHYFLTDKGYLILVPLPEKKYRLIASLKGNHPGKDQVDLSIENFQKILNERGAGNIWIKKSIWSTSANFYHKLADCAMQGNTFLVGDALHQFSPVGGTNMNTGIQDAFHLAEKITLVKKKKQAVSYLESYASERMQAAKKIMAVTENATNLLTRNSSSIEEEQKYLPLMRNRSFIKSALPRLFSGLDFMG